MTILTRVIGPKQPSLHQQKKQSGATPPVLGGHTNQYSASDSGRHRRAAIVGMTSSEWLRAMQVEVMFLDYFARRPVRNH